MIQVTQKQYEFLRAQAFKDKKTNPGASIAKSVRSMLDQVMLIVKNGVILLFAVMLFGCGKVSQEVADSPKLNNDLYLNSAVITPMEILAPSKDDSRPDTDYTIDCRIIEDNGIYYMYYAGCKAENQRGRESAMVATSNDGINWSRSDKVILPVGDIGSYDCDRAWGAVTVLKEDGVFKMWNAGDSNMEMQNHTSRIGYATSNDGINWIKYPGKYAGAIFEDFNGVNDGCKGAVQFAVIKKDGLYHSFYTALDNSGYLKYANSPDGINWEAKSVVMTNVGGVGNVVEIDGYYYMTTTRPDYLGVKVFRSTNLTHWELFAAYTVAEGGMYYPFIIKINDELRLYYSYNTDGNEQNARIGMLKI
jgi:predicted GH43/DUF377 family glycosyl hydrolase